MKYDEYSGPEPKQSEVKKIYPHFTPGNSPNHSQRRRDDGINKRGLHKPKDGKMMQLMIDKLRFVHYKQMVPIKNKAGQIISYRKIIHTRYQP